MSEITNPNQLEWKLPSQADRNQRPMWWALLVLLAVVAYAQVVKDSGFIWDDDRHITLNKNLHDMDGLVNIWTKFGLKNGGSPQYYPLTHTLWWIEYQLWGDEPLGYHLVNVLLHGASAILIWEILRKLKVPGSWLAAAIWAVHPINVESVAWVTEMKNVLAGVFFFGAILAYLNAKDAESLGGNPRTPDPDSVLRLPPLPDIAWFGISFGLFVCALLSKTVACTMPVVMILILWWQRKLKVRDFAILLPFIILGVVMGRITASIEVNQVGATGSEWDFTKSDRILIAGRAIWFYIGKILAPVHQSFIYPRWHIDPSQTWQWVFPILALLVLFILIGIAKFRRWPLVAYLYFVITLFPALGFFNVYPMRYSFVADHFQYLSGIAVIACVAALLSMFVRNIQAAAIGSCVVIALLACISWVRGSVYYDKITLWQDVIAKNPSSWMAHHNYGVALEEDAADFASKGNPQEAKQEFDEAEKEFRRTLDINPQHEWAHFSLGSVYFREHRLSEAQHELEESLKYSPEPARNYAQLGRLMMVEKNTAKAEEYLKKSIELENHPLKARIIPNPLAETRIWLGEIYELQGKNKEAEQAYLDALKIKPHSREALINVGVVLGKLGKDADAAEAFKAILRDNPEDAEAWKLLGIALAREDQNHLAEGALEQSLKIRPGQKDVERTLALVQDAIAHPGRRAATRSTTTKSSTAPASTQTAR